MGMVLEPVAGDGSVGKGVGGLGGLQWQVHPINLSSAPGYMVVLVGEAAIWTVTFLGFGSWCGSW